MIDPITGSLLITSFALAPASRLPSGDSVIGSGQRKECVLESSGFHYDISNLPVWPIPGTPSDEVQEAITSRFSVVDDLGKVLSFIGRDREFIRVMLDAPKVISGLLGREVAIDLEYDVDAEDDFERLYVVVHTDIENAQERLTARKLLITHWLYGKAGEHSERLALRVS